MKEHVGIANVLTTGSLVAGFLSLISVSEANVVLGVSLISLAAVFDALDGPVARSTRTTSAFGGNLDSLADMVSFGIAPALALYLASLHAVPVVGVLACGTFAVCAAWRLARFPLVKESQTFVGCPAPAAALIVAPFAALQMGPECALPVVVSMSYLMVGSVRFPTLAALRQLILGPKPTPFGAGTTQLH